MQKAFKRIVSNGDFEAISERKYQTDLKNNDLKMIVTAFAQQMINFKWLHMLI